MAVVAGRSPARPRSRRLKRHVLVSMVLLSIALSALTFWAGAHLRGATTNIPQHVLEPRATVPIERRVLTDALKVEGTVEAPAGVAVSVLPPQLEGEEAPLVSNLPVHTHTRITAGTVLVEIAGRPIVALPGTIPMYRTLKVGMVGEDVAQFQHALNEAGSSFADPYGTFGESTAEAAAAMFRERGYDLPLAPLAHTEHRTGSTQTAQGAAGSTPKRKGKKTASSVAPTRLLPMVPLWSVVYLSHLPAYVSKVGAQLGQPVAGALLTASWKPPIVTAALEASQLQTIHVGMRVTSREMPSSTGVVRSIAPESAPAAGAATTGNKVTISFPARTRMPPLGAQLEISILRSTSRTRRWCVPFSAVRNGSGVSNFVEIQRNGRFLRIPVLVGISAQGYVAITPIDGSRLRQAERVAVGE